MEGMNKKVFKVSIFETLEREIEVLADNEDQAFNIADRLYSEEKVVLNADDFKGFEIYAKESDNQKLASAIRTLQANDSNGSWEEVESKLELIKTLETALEEGRDKEIEEFYKDILKGVE